MPQLIEGSPVEVQGSGAKPYILKNVGGVYSCSCPAWRNQSLPIDRRTCKHLRSHCGSANEDARIGGKPAMAPSGAPVVFPAVSAAPSPPTGAETEDEVLAAIFNRTVTISGRVPASAPNASATPAEEPRKLRPDEKAKLNGPPVLLAQSFEDFDDLDPTGWWYSEKLDGVRGYWNGKDFISRQGNVFHAPDWFKAGLPDHPLDGELWMARKSFQKTISVVKRLDAGKQWESIRYVVFDAPHMKAPFEDRMIYLWNLMPKGSARIPWAEVHPHSKLQSRKHLMDELRAYEALGAEGLMIRKPGSLYEARRSATLLKVKPFKDAEAEVISHEPGKGRHKGRLGALVVRMPNGKTFNVGTGLSDADRDSPPKIGATITYRYTEHTDDGIPKCASFVCVRDYE